MEREADAAASLTMLRGFYGAGETLKSDLPPELYRRVLQRATQLGIPAASVVQMRPWLLALTISILAASAASFEPSIGIDAYLLNRSAGKHVSALETAEFQIGLFSGLPMALQACMLEESADADVASVERLLELWRAGDAQQLGALMHDALAHPDGEALYQVIFVERNRQMAATVERLLADVENYLVVAPGIRHFLGPDNVLRLLECAGFPTVRLSGMR